MQKQSGRRRKQSLGDIGACRGVGGGGQANHLHIAERFGDAADLAIFGAKVVSPFRNAMRFINRETAGTGATQF